MSAPTALPTARPALIGALIAAAGGLALVLSLFLTWFELPGSQFGQGLPGDIGDVIGIDVSKQLSRTAWESLEVIDVLCAVAGSLAFLRGAVALLGSSDNPEIPGAVLTGSLGAVALALVTYRVIDPPRIGYNRELGLWIALVAAAAIVYGSYLAFNAARRQGA